MDTAARNALIAELRRNGATLEQIADRVGVTSQRVCRILQTRGASDDDLPKTGRGQGVPCPDPKCGGHSKTIRTYRPTRDGIVRRRHECLSCGQRWSSRQFNETPRKISSTATDSVPMR